MHRYEPGSRDISICLFSSLLFTCLLFISLPFSFVSFAFFSFHFLPFFVSCLTFPYLPSSHTTPLASIPFPNFLSSFGSPWWHFSCLTLQGQILKHIAQCWGSHSIFLIRPLKVSLQASSAASNISVGTGYQMGGWPSGRLEDRHTSLSEAHLKSSQKTA